jgi:tetratricopeptide (TPR) repeat protein
MVPSSAASSPRLEPYLFVEPVGTGALGEVWKAFDPTTGRHVAVKLLARDLGRTPDLAWVLRREVYSMARLDHDHIVRVLDFHDRDRPAIVLELANGKSFAELGERASWPLLRARLVSILGALGHAHARGVLHRDLHPGNLLRFVQGEREVVKIADFGLARSIERVFGAASHGSSVGAIRYAAPESQLARGRDVGPWTDLYALGPLAVDLAGLRRPAEEPSTHGVPEDELASLEALAGGLAGWVERACDPDPDARFRNAAEARRALDAIDAAPAPRTRVEARLHRVEPPPLALVRLRALPMVGREREREALRSALDEVLGSRTSRAMVLTGWGGVGKSRLAASALEDAREEGLAEGFVFGPRHSLEHVIEHALRASTLRGAALLRHVRRRLPSLDEPVREAVIAMLERRDDSSGRGMTRATLVASVLGALAERTPLVLVLDDVHDAPDLLDLADALLGASRQARILVVATVRQDLLAERGADRARMATFCERPNVGALSIGPLDAEAHRTLARDLLGLASGTAAIVEERSRGNPLFAIQLVSDWIDNGLLATGSLGHELVGAEAPRMPADLVAVWSARIERLLDGRADDESMSLEIAAVLGDRVRFDEWEKGCALAGVLPSHDLVRSLVDRHLAIAHRDGWEWVHPMLGATLRQRSIDAGRAERQHLACAALLEGARSPEVEERRGVHLVLADRVEDGARVLLRAARERVVRREATAATRLLDRYDHALDRLPIPSDDRARIEGAIVRAIARRSLGELEVATRLAEQASRAAEARGVDDLLAAAEHQRGRIALEAARFGEALALLRRAAELASTLGDRSLLGRCRMDQGAVSLRRAELAEANALFSLASDDFRALGMNADLGMSALLRAQVAKRLERYDEARALAREAQAILRAATCVGALPEVANELGELARLTGDLDEAERHYLEARAGYRAIGSAQAAVAELNIAMLFVMRSRYVEAEALLVPARDFLRRIGRRSLFAIANIALLPVAASRSDWTAFAEYLADARSALEATGIVEADAALMAIRAAELARDRGNPRCALDAYAIALDQLRRLSHSSAVAVEREIESLRAAIAAAP